MNPRLLITLTLMLLSQSVLLAVSPLVTDDADTVEPGKLQLNCDFQFVRTSSTLLRGYSVISGAMVPKGRSRPPSMPTI